MKRVDSFIVLCSLILVIMFQSVRGEEDEEDEDPFTTTDPKKREPSPCEVCKMFTTELQDRLDESAKSKAVIETGHGLERKKKFPYKFSETRLTEALLEPHICEKILEYNVHAERKGSLRYAKGRSETMSALHGLVDKGVKVELGMPYEMWDMPAAEVSKMQRQCFRIAEEYEEDIEDWYYKLQDDVPISKYLCADRYLKNRDQSCLEEVFVSKGDDDGEKKKRKKKKKKKNADKKGDLGGADVPDPPPAEGKKDEL